MSRTFIIEMLIGALILGVLINCTGCTTLRMGHAGKWKTGADYSPKTRTEITGDRRY